MVKSIKEIYRCDVCGNLVEVLTVGGGELICCGQPMILLKGNDVDASVEKHVPVIEEIEGGYQIKVGQEDHPMTDAHFIEWISIETKKKLYRKFLKPHDKPVAKFKTNCKILKASCYCNLHSLWIKKGN